MLFTGMTTLEELRSNVLDRHRRSITERFSNLASTQKPRNVCSLHRFLPESKECAFFLGFQQPCPVPVSPVSRPSLSPRQTPAVPLLTDSHDRIHRERRAHTIAPLRRIAGPSCTPQAKMFATPFAPVHLLAVQSSLELTDDDERPLIVKVRYDADAGARPSERAVRQAIDEQLQEQQQQRANQRMKHEPLIVNFLGQPAEVANRSRSILYKHRFPRPPKPVLHQRFFPQRTRPSLCRSQSSLKGFSSRD